LSKKTSNKSFGILFFFIFLGFGLWPITNENSPTIYLIIISIIFLILGLLNSKILSPLNSFWIKFGELLGKIIAPVIMAIIYFIILTPISIIVRLFGKDLLSLKFTKQIKTYWIKRTKDLNSMNKQF
tara:strand:+ start:207 stop:587 length:381 start_codon:yes stop_codon:yes gene_type:complete